SSIQRQAERVTAEEIRVMANELEQGLGGIYSLLAQELQRPFVIRLMHQMAKADELPHLPENVTPMIVTGVEGLRRNTDLLRLDALLAGTSQTFAPEALAKYAHVGAYIKRRAAALSLNIDGLIRSDDEVQAADEAAMQAQLAQSLGPKAIEANAKRD